MTTEQAKEILLRYRKGIPVIEDRALAEALEAAKNNPELGQWLSAHTLFQQQVCSELRSIQPPGELRSKILAGRPAKAKWPKRTFIAAAAAILVLLGLASYWFQPKEEQTLAAFQARMVSFALREYSMDIVTNDVTAVRSFLQSQQAPADFPLPVGLVQAEVKGGAKLSWQNIPVAMVCFKLDPGETLYLFVLPSEAFSGRKLPSQTDIKAISRLTTATWQQGANVYFLAGNASPEVLKKFLAEMPIHFKGSCVVLNGQQILTRPI